MSINSKKQRANDDIRFYAQENQAFFWEIAQHLGICENTLYRRMRFALSDEEKETIMSAIDAVASEHIGG